MMFKDSFTSESSRFSLNEHIKKSTEIKTNGFKKFSLN